MHLKLSKRSCSLQHRCGWQVWVLTGDKIETAISIALACQLFSPFTKLLMLREKDLGSPNSPQVSDVLQLKTVEIKRLLAIGSSSSRLAIAMAFFLQHLPSRPQLKACWDLLTSVCPDRFVCVGWWVRAFCCGNSPQPCLVQPAVFCAIEVYCKIYINAAESFRRIFVVKAATGLAFSCEKVPQVIGPLCLSDWQWRASPMPKQMPAHTKIVRVVLQGDWSCDRGRCIGSGLAAAE